MSNVKVRLGVLTSVFALAAGLVAVGATPAAAEDAFSFGGLSIPSAKSYQITVENETRGVQSGYAMWQGDGDTLTARDGLADGYGIVAHLSTGRVASTAGQTSPITVNVTGDLPENVTYKMWVCVVKGSWSKCSSKIDVKS
ncbi:hypothetical protein [Streptomyces adonidis]|uniref:hypothetical protein n=1 Tax=Streptomyces adonidis TaxID=3231367 RepID=UPI0034DB7066